MKIYLIRHGETDWNREERLQGQADIALNDRGIKQARAAVETLSHVPFDQVFCSPLCRARDTADLVKGDRKIAVTEDDRLLEIGFGCYEGRSISEIEKDQNDPFYHFFKAPAQYCPPKTAESFQELYARSENFMRQVIFPLEGSCETVLIVAHGALNRSIVNPLAGISLEDFWKLSMENCSVFILELKEGRLTLLDREEG